MHKTPDPMTHLTGKTCDIRPWKRSDKSALVAQANNYKIWKNLRDRFPYPYTPEDAEWWLDFTAAQHPQTNFAIVVEGNVAGGIGLEMQEDVQRVSAELGYWLGEEYWGRGIAAAAIRLLTPWALKSLGLCRIYALPFAPNAASCRALEKAGYRKEGVLRRSVCKKGQVLDQVLYAFTDQES